MKTHKLGLALSFTTVLNGCIVIPEGYSQTQLFIPAQPAPQANVSLVLPSLPVGYIMVNLTTAFYDGLYYQHTDRGYVVIDAPVGVEIHALPKGYKRSQIDGHYFYQSKGNWYQYDKNHKKYRVVANPHQGNKHGNGNGHDNGRKH